ncbi:hypothetical protein HQ305_06765 [Rhodococcus sp. BP-149]|uniref:LGFP repeat-containing protein n=1 Tax=unclassified Rhodococcus (in: high G+C Gram-positive bacteria) TaxID=192944 RepID=UPI001C9B7C80|nr:MULTISPECIES: hypothetical protein [unclassified Rhodococcus (in: high G+C Gram-positive bacteria)]MBY6683994.1 hypothetical protein [Rhodococcus sp. BP-288]MBY6693345.1 hypothetical protein [Rhodococcus sp. BP-188]MBY6697542.1 hypothetical protein [Rhodococcus sp. BP-285]MBY6702219.1 hypothetical protein [Rhodococcus sp. BP-283]MBY6706502.1 hypothetical protein [Rhodococcus sp. BP-241]
MTRSGGEGINDLRLQQIQLRRAASRAIPAPGPDCQQYWPLENWVCGAIRDKYNSMGAQFSFLFVPTSEELVNPDGFGRRQTFINGPIYWSPQGGAHPVVNHFFAAWQRLGWEGGVLGYPTTDEIVNPDGVGRRQEFQGAAVYWRLNEAYAIGGAIRDKWNTTGAESGPLGYPSTDEIGVTKYSGRYNNFGNGTITWSGPTGPRLLFKPLRDKWAESGREDGPHVYPTSDEQVLDNDIARIAPFESGSSIIWSQVTGAWFISAELLDAWNQERSAGFDPGFPTGDVDTAPTSVIDSIAVRAQQAFQRGRISIDIEGTRFVVGFDPDGVFPDGDNAFATDSELESQLRRQDDEDDDDYDSSSVLATASREEGITYGPELPLRVGYYNEDSDVGWGYDKAYNKHGVKRENGEHAYEPIVDTFENGVVLDRRDADVPGNLFGATVTRIRLLDGRTKNNFYVVYDPRNAPTHKGLPAGDPIGVEVAFCGGMTVCDQWIIDAFY